MSQYVRVGIAASLIGVTPKTIRRWDFEREIIRVFSRSKLKEMISGFDYYY